MRFDEYLQNRARRERIRTPVTFDARVDDTLRSLTGRGEGLGAALPVRRLSRRALGVLIAAAILLVTATALAAVYFSRMQKFKDETKDALDASFAAWSPDAISPKGIQASAAGVELTLRDLWYQAPNEYNARGSIIANIVCYAPSARAGGTAESLTLTVNDDAPIAESYTEYVQDAQYPLIFEQQSDPSEGYLAFLTASFRVDENPVREGNTLVFAGKLDGEAFTMTYALDAAVMAQLKAEAEAEYQQSVALLEAIPQEAAEVELSFLGYAIKEVAVKDGWMYLTQQTVPEYWEGREMSGRESSPEAIALGCGDLDVFPYIDGCAMLHEALGNVDQAYPDGYVYRTFIGRSRDKLPARSLIAFSGIVFYYEWATDTVIAPANEAEQAEWRQRHMELFAQNGMNDAHFSFSEDTAAFTATDIVFTNSLWGMIGLALNTPDAYERAREDIPVFTIDGETLHWLGEPMFHPDESRGRSQRGNMRHGYNYVGVSFADLPARFEVTVEWRGETARFTLNKADAAIQRLLDTDYGKIFGY